MSSCDLVALSSLWRALQLGSQVVILLAQLLHLVRHRALV